MNICERCGEPVGWAEDGIWRLLAADGEPKGRGACLSPEEIVPTRLHEVPVFPDFHDLPAVEQWLAS